MYEFGQEGRDYSYKGRLLVGGVVVAERVSGMLKRYGDEVTGDCIIRSPESPKTVAAFPGQFELRLDTGVIHKINVTCHVEDGEELENRGNLRIAFQI